MTDTDDWARHSLEVVRARFLATKSLADRAVAQLSDADLHQEPSPGSNSVAVMMTHITGNQRSRWTDFLTSDGEKSWRHRDREFEAAGLSRAVLLSDWEQGWALLDASLASLGPADLLRDILIRGEPQSVVSAIERQMAHYAYHVGQIVYVARWLRGAAFETLSVARGASDAYNESMGHGPERTDA